MYHPEHNAPAIAPQAPTVRFVTGAVLRLKKDRISRPDTNPVTPPMRHPWISRIRISELEYPIVILCAVLSRHASQVLPDLVFKCAAAKVVLDLGSAVCEVALG